MLPKHSIGKKDIMDKKILVLDLGSFRCTGMMEIFACTNLRKICLYRCADGEIKSATCTRKPNDEEKVRSSDIPSGIDHHSAGSSEPT